MRRVTVVGASGSGKSTVARRLAARLDVEFVELDVLYHRPNWEPTPTVEFRRRVIEALAAAEERTGGWVVAGNYVVSADIHQARADTVVWLDLARWRCWWRVTRRSVRRAAMRQELWAGNRERWRDLVSLDPEVNMILWAWRTPPTVRERYEQWLDGPLWAGPAVHRLRSPALVRNFVAAT